MKFQRNTGIQNHRSAQKTEGDTTCVWLLTAREFMQDKFVCCAFCLSARKSRAACSLTRFNASGCCRTSSCCKAQCNGQWDANSL
eukprot:5218888-Amphidinium_carterae.1